MQVTLLAIVMSAVSLQAQDNKKTGPQQIYPVAVFPFAERGSDVKDLGTQVSDLLFANLVVNPEMFLVEREEIKKLLDEQELNLSGLVNPDQATKVGQEWPSYFQTNPFRLPTLDRRMGGRNERGIELH